LSCIASGHTSQPPSFPPRSGQGAFVVCLDAQAPSFDGVSIEVKSSAGDTVTFKNILFGDVWACSGQR
jgi:hypothetical protein